MEKKIDMKSSSFIRVLGSYYLHIYRGGGVIYALVFRSLPWVFSNPSISKSVIAPEERVDPFL